MLWCALIPDAITWIDAPEEQYPILGSRYKVKCKVQANPAPIVDWLRNGQQITPDNKHYGVDGDGLLINGVTEEDDGIYICRAIVLDTGELSERNIKVEVKATWIFFSILFSYLRHKQKCFKDNTLKSTRENLSKSSVTSDNRTNHLLVLGLN